MLAVRNIRLSVKKSIEALFTSGVAFENKFTVYDESVLRDDGFSGTRPFVVLIDSRVLFETRHLPLIVIETRTERIPFEMGRSAFLAVVELNVFGRSRGERDDLSSAIMQHIDGFNLYDFGGSEPVLLGWSPIEIDWSERHMSIETNAAIEGSLAHWTQLTAGFPVLAYEN